MQTLPTDAAVIECAYRSRSGHHDYDRGIRDHLSDARWYMPTLDPKGQAYWCWRALTLAHLHLMDARYQWDADKFDDAQRRALESLKALGMDAESIAYAASALRAA